MAFELNSGVASKGKQEREESQELSCSLALSSIASSFSAPLRRWCFEHSPGLFPPTARLGTPSPTQPAGGIGERKGEARAPPACC